MPLRATRCPADPDETAEAYCMNAFDPADAASFVEHLLVCSRCLAIVQAAEDYVRALRSAALELAHTTPECEAASCT